MEISKKRLVQIINEEIMAMGDITENQDEEMKAMAAQLAAMDQAQFTTLMNAVDAFRKAQQSF